MISSRKLQHYCNDWKKNRGCQQSRENFDNPQNFWIPHDHDFCGSPSLQPWSTRPRNLQGRKRRQKGKKNRERGRKPKFSSGGNPNSGDFENVRPNNYTDQPMLIKFTARDKNMFLTIEIIIKNVITLERMTRD